MTKKPSQDFRKLYGMAVPAVLGPVSFKVLKEEPLVRRANLNLASGAIKE